MDPSCSRYLSRASDRCLSDVPDERRSGAADCFRGIGGTSTTQCPPSVPSAASLPIPILRRAVHSHSPALTAAVPMASYIRATAAGSRIRGTVTIHTASYVEGRDPTCTSSGYYGYSRCSVCGSFISSMTTIPATGHDYGEWFETIPATCTSQGQEQRACRNKGCSARETPHDRRERSYMGQRDGHVEPHLSADGYDDV